MKRNIMSTKRHLFLCVFLLGSVQLLSRESFAQTDSTVAPKVAAPVTHKPVKNTFQNVWLIDDQSVMVPIKGTFEMDIQHRFGTVQNGIKDFFGIYASANMRLGFNYAPVKNLNLGFGLEKANMLVDGSAKYAIVKQTPGKYPVSVTYYGNLGYKTISDPSHYLFTYQTERLSYFNQIIVARKINNKFSAQASLSISHQNSVPGFYARKDTVTYVYKYEKFDMFTGSVCARYKVSAQTAVIVEYDQPLTKFATKNPNPNLAFGFEFSTSGHTFQLFAGNYSLLNPQQNSLYNANNPFGFKQTDGQTVKGGQFMIGFNITRLWNF
jgi:hypothetical protein